MVYAEDTKVSLTSKFTNRIFNHEGRQGFRRDLHGGTKDQLKP
jgi:hypothetical protein